MMIRRVLFVAIALVASFVPLVSAQEGLALMKVETGARPAGMAGAFVSITSDPNASFYNPAAAAWAEKFNLSFGHNEYWENIRLETGYFMANLSPRVSVHGGIRFGAVDNLESRLVPSSEPDAIFSAYDASFKGGLTYRLDDRLAFGAAMGWFIEKIDIYRGSAFNVDLGALYRLTDSINLGASVTNLGSSLSLALSGQQGTRDISLPTTYRVGASYQYRYVLGSIDGVIVDDEFHLHVGAEADLHEYVAVRAGYMFNYDSKNFTAGASFKRRNITVDYAFVPYTNNLGTSHLFNLTFAL